MASQAPSPTDAAPAPAGRCMNCGAIPTGPYCQECSQHQDDLHRPVLTLAREVFDSFIDLDGRLWQTVPRLFFRPSSLTRDYLAGHRVSQTPPLRMLLLAILLAFFLAQFHRAAPTTQAHSRPPQAAPAVQSGPRGRSITERRATPPRARGGICLMNWPPATLR